MEKITKEGQSCGKCGTAVVKKIPIRNHFRNGQKYFFKYYFRCPKCKTFYMVESQKVFLDKLEKIIN